MNTKDVFSKVSIVRSEKAWANELSYDDIKLMVNRAVELSGGLESIVKPGMTVVIKPNLVISKDSFSGSDLGKELNGITADWRVAKAVVDLVRNINTTGKIYIMEGSAEYKTTDVMNKLNYDFNHIPGVDGFIGIEEDSGEWQDFNSEKLCRVDLQNGLLHKEYYLNKRYKEADVLISIACLKSHGSAVITGGIKNLGIGATPANIYGASQTDNSRMNMVAHDNKDGDLHKWIHDYYLCRPADFVVLDGLQGYQNGPAPGFVNSSNEDKMNMRLVMAGRDAVAVDTIAALIMNWDPESIGYLKYLSNSHAGVMDVSGIKVEGNTVDQVRKDFGIIKLPTSGAEKIATKIAPRFYIRNLQNLRNELILEIGVIGEAVKIEYYVDGKMLSEVLTVKNKTGKVNLQRATSGEHQLKVVVYDRFLNSSEQIISFHI